MDAVSYAVVRKRGEIWRSLDRREITATQAYARIQADMGASEILYRSILGDDRYDLWSNGWSMTAVFDRDTFLCAHGRGAERFWPSVRVWFRSIIPTLPRFRRS